MKITVEDHKGLISIEVQGREAEELKAQFLKLALKEADARIEIYRQGELADQDRSKNKQSAP